MLTRVICPPKGRPGMNILLTSSSTTAMAMSMARSAAITYGEILTNDEMENLVNELFACENVNYTPDGHSVFAIMQQKSIEQLLD